MASFKKAVVDVNLMDTLSESVRRVRAITANFDTRRTSENKISRVDQWQFPGIGEFQCYDQRALGGSPERVRRLGTSNGEAQDRTMRAGTTTSRTRRGFSAHTKDRGTRRRPVFPVVVLGRSWDTAIACFDARGPCLAAGRNLETALAIKCAGVHWWYNSRSHAAELTAGYFNTRSGDNVPERDGYEPIVKICGKHGARLNFTCTEMRDIEHPFFSRCGPEDCFDRFEPPPRDTASRWLARMRCVGSIRTPTTRSSSTVAERVTTGTVEDRRALAPHGVVHLFATEQGALRG